MRNHILGAVICLILSALSVQLLGQRLNEANYYKSIMLDGKNNLIGKYPMADSIGAAQTCYEFVHNEKGKLIRVKYKRADGFLQQDPFYGVAQIKITYYDKGFQKREFLNEKGKPMLNANGVGQERYRFDAKNQPVGLYNYDVAGGLIQDIYGVTHYMWELDQQGRRIISMRFDEEGNRILDNKGIYELHYKYDNQGNLNELKIVGADGKPFENVDGYAMIRWKFDVNRNETEAAFYNAAGKLTVNNNGVARIVWSYDKLGNRVKEIFFDENNNLAENKDTYAYTVWEYSEEGDLIGQTRHGIFDQLREYKGAAITKWVYEEDSRKVKTRMYGVDEQLKKNNYGNGLVW